MPWRCLLFFDFIYSFSILLPKNSIKTVKARIRTGHLKNLQKLLLNTFDVCEIFCEAKWRLLVSMKFSARPNENFWSLWNFLRDQMGTFDVSKIFSEAKWELLVSMKFSAGPNGDFWCLWNFPRGQMGTFGVCEIFSESKWKLLVSVKFSARPNENFWSLWNFQQDQMETFDSVIENRNCRMNKNDRLDKIYLQP